MRRFFPSTFALALCLIASNQAWAQFSGIVVNPNPIKIGYPATYSLVGTSQMPVKSYYWQYRTHTTTCVNPVFTDITATPHDPAETVIEAKPGTYDIQCTIEFNGNINMPNPNPQILPLTVTVPPPDGFRVDPTSLGGAPISPIAGQPNDITGTQGKFVKFILTQGGADCGPYLDGKVQEKNVGIELFFQAVADTDWVPTNPPTVRFYLSGNTVYDYKMTLADTNYLNFPNGSMLPFLKYEQHLRFLWTDACGATQSKEFPNSVKLQNRKIDNTQYTIELQ